MRQAALGHRFRHILSVFFFSTLLCNGFAHAAPAASSSSTIPEPLRPWAGWVTRDQEERGCPISYSNGDEHHCYWPSTLEIALDKRGGTFTQRIELYRELRVELPGDGEHWPQDVKVDGKPAPVTAAQDGTPQVALPAGTHSVAGSFAWDEMPESLQVPAETGLVALRLDGQAVAQPRLDKGGHLWLQARAGGEDAADSLELHVSRQIEDSIPLQVTTSLVFSVAGKNRESVFPAVVLPGYTPTSITSDLPARLEADGRLRVQLRPGQWSIAVTARRMGPQQKVTLPVPATGSAALTDQEVWVFLGHNNLRVVTPSGGTPVDGKLVDLPTDWSTLPAFQMHPGDTMTLAESKRGDPEAAPDKLSLSRNVWLDFDGNGYSVRDRIFGEFHRTWRLDLQAPASLGHVQVDNVDQFITRDGKEDGIEVRNGQASIVAESRIDGSARTLPATGWREDFQAADVDLKLPAGWRLLAATGVDTANGSWVSRWSLLDFFVVLVVAFSFGRLWGVRWGVVAAATLIIAYQEPGAPRWLWLAALAGAALVTVLPEQAKLRKVASWYRGAALLVLILVCLPFALQQMRQAIYPVLDVQNQYQSEEIGAHVALDTATPAAPAPAMMEDKEALRKEAPPEPASPVPDVAMSPPPPPPPKIGSFSRSHVEAKGAIGNPYGGNSGEEELQRFDPNAIVQTGPGMPSWQHHSYRLAWRGPVDQGQEMHLWLIPPWLNSMLDVLRILLIALLIARLLNVPLRWRPKRTGPAALATLFACALALATLAPNEARADVIPDKETQDQLKELLSKPAPCLPNCADIARMNVDARGETLELRLDVHASQDVAVPLPSGGARWSVAGVVADGKPAAGLVRDEDGALWIALDAGVHQVVMQGTVGHAENVQLALPLKPHRVESKVEGWTIAGIRENGLADDNLQLTRIVASGSKALQDNVLPAFVRVERTLQLGLQWRIHTRVIRLVPREGPIVVAVPLLPGESISAAEPRVDKGVAQVSLGPQSDELDWDSNLAQSPEIALHAAKQDDLIEQWTLDAGPMWHVDVSGIAPVQHENERGRWQPVWQPWPGEEVHVKVGKPQGAPGQSLTLDTSAYHVEPGLRSSEMQLELRLRSSRAGLHTITLPEGAVLRRVEIAHGNETSTPALQLEGRKLSLPLLPGAQRITVEWRQPTGITAWFRTPAVDLGLPGVNATVDIALPHDRWPLALGGPRAGPAILIWGIIATMALVAFGLARTGVTPLRWHHWFLLAIGLTQITVIDAALIVIWLLALGVRKKHGEHSSGGVFNLVQVVLAFLTLIALCMLFMAVQASLIGYPDMQVEGNFGDPGNFAWYQDRHGDTLPQPWVLSLPMLVYRGLMLLWALWLAYSLLKWLRWGWEAYTAGGYWRSKPKKADAEVKPDIQPETAGNAETQGTPTAFEEPPASP